MNISIIGTGRMGQALATSIRHTTPHPVYLGSREEEKGEHIAARLDPDRSQIIGKSIPEAAALGEIIIFAFPWYALVDVERAVGPLKGKIIIDCINPLTSSGSLALGHKRSAAEEIQSTFPLAKVVKGFHHIYCDHLSTPIFQEKPLAAFYCSDHDDAKRAFQALAQALGFEPIDSGPIKHARYLEPMSTLWIQMAFHMGLGPDMAFTLVKR